MNIVDAGAVLFIALGVTALLAIVAFAVVAVLQILRATFIDGPLLRLIWLVVVFAVPAIGPGFWFLLRSNNSRWAR